MSRGIAPDTFVCHRVQSLASNSKNTCWSTANQTKSQMAVRTESELVLIKCEAKLPLALRLRFCSACRSTLVGTFSCRGTTPDFGPRPLCVLESCLLRTVTRVSWCLRRRAPDLLACCAGVREALFVCPTRCLDLLVKVVTVTCVARPCARGFV